MQPCLLGSERPLHHQPRTEWHLLPRLASVHIDFFKELIWLIGPWDVELNQNDRISDSLSSNMMYTNYKHNDSNGKASISVLIQHTFYCKNSYIRKPSAGTDIQILNFGGTQKDDRECATRKTMTPERSLCCHYYYTITVIVLIE
jgi:hypothetical protein